MFASITGPPSERGRNRKRGFREKEKCSDENSARARVVVDPGGVRARRLASFVSRRSSRPFERTEKHRRGLRPRSFLRGVVRRRRLRFRRQPHVPPPVERVLSKEQPHEKRRGVALSHPRRTQKRQRPPEPRLEFLRRLHTRQRRGVSRQERERAQSQFIPRVHGGAEQRSGALLAETRRVRRRLERVRARRETFGIRTGIRRRVGIRTGVRWRLGGIPRLSHRVEEIERGVFSLVRRSGVRRRQKRAHEPPGPRRAPFTPLERRLRLLGRRRASASNRRAVPTPTVVGIGPRSFSRRRSTSGRRSARLPRAGTRF